MTFNTRELFDILVVRRFSVMAEINFIYKNLFKSEPSKNISDCTTGHEPTTS